MQVMVKSWYGMNQWPWLVAVVERESAVMHSEDLLKRKWWQRSDDNPLGLGLRLLVITNGGSA